MCIKKLITTWVTSVMGHSEGQVQMAQSLRSHSISCRLHLLAFKLIDQWALHTMPRSYQATFESTKLHVNMLMLD